MRDQKSNLETFWLSNLRTNENSSDNHKKLQSNDSGYSHLLTKAGKHEVRSLGRGNIASLN